MAPLVKTTIQLLLSYLNVLNPQSILKGKSPNAAALAHPGAPSLSAISLGRRYTCKMLDIKDAEATP